MTFFLLYNALKVSAAAISAKGFWITPPESVWDQVRYALRLPNYDIIKEWNNIDNINEVEPGRNYTVPYLESPRSPAGWRTKIGVAYLELNSATVIVASIYATSTPVL